MICMDEIRDLAWETGMPSDDWKKVSTLLQQITAAKHRSTALEEASLMKVITNSQSSEDDAYESGRWDAHSLNAGAYGYGPNGDMFREDFIGSAYDPEC